MPNKISECSPGIYKIGNGEQDRLLIVYDQPQFNYNTKVWENCHILYFKATFENISKVTGKDWDSSNDPLRLTLAVPPFKNMKEKILKVHEMIVERNLLAKIKT